MSSGGGIRSFEFIEKKIAKNEDRKLFAEAVRTAKASAPRAVYFTLWICWVESLKRRFGELLKCDSTVIKLPVETSAKEATLGPLIAVLVEKAQQYGLLLSAGTVKLERIYSINNFAARLVRSRRR